MAKVYIEETLLSDQVDVAVAASPYLLHSEVIEGARRPLAFLQVVSENRELIGAIGYTIKVITASQLGAHSSTEEAISGATHTGMPADTKTLGMVSVAVPDVIWSAVQLSDVLGEDFPNIDWVRLNLRNMGKAVMETIDASIESVLVAAAGTETSSTATLSYSAVVDAIAKMENADWIIDPNDAPFLLVAPDSAAGLVKDTSFVSTERYTTYEVANMVQGELGKFAGLRVLKSSLLDGVPYSFIVFPESTNGVVLTLAWKRPLTVKNERSELYAYTYFVTSARAKAAVLQAKGICKITLTTTP